MFQRWPLIAGMAGILFFAACGPDDKDPNNPGGPSTSETHLLERDGIPSPNAVDRLLYFVSTHEDGPGLYSFNPATPEAAPYYVDPEINLSYLFAHPIHRGERQADDTIVDFHAGGVFYSNYFSKDFGGDVVVPDTTFGQQYLVSAEPSEATTPPRRIGYTEMSAALMGEGGGGGLFSYGLDALEESSYTPNMSHMDDNFRIDFDLGEDDTPLIFPEGKFIISMIGEGVNTHEHWLHRAENNGELRFYNRDLSQSEPLLDDATNDPIVGTSFFTQYVSQLSESEAIVVIAFEADETEDAGLQGAIYLVTRPDASNPGGRAKRLLNSDGDPYLASVGLIVFGTGVPAAPLLFQQDGVLYFANGPSLFSDAWTTLTRVDRNGWSQLNHRDVIVADGTVADSSLLQSFLPPVFIPLEDGRIFWSPGNNAEIIAPNAGAWSTWERKPIAAPRAEDTPILTSKNGWVFYNSNDGPDAAVAINVDSEEVLSFPGSKWIGASHDGTSDIAGSVLQSNLSEVFLHHRNGELRALEAGAPDKGYVVLGPIPATTNELAIGGLGRGPNRLFRILHEDQSVEVLFADTRRKGSLSHLMPEPAHEWERPLGFESGGVERTAPIYPQWTRPILGF